MGAICGKNGTVNGSGATIRSWSINIETDLLDATTMGSNGYREYIECLTGATGSLTATERFAGGATISLENTNTTYGGTVKFGTEAVETPVEGLVLYTHDFTFSGSVVVA